MIKMTKNKKSIVVLPTYNERDNLPRIVPEILAQGVDIVIVDDNSPDGTGRLADGLAKKHKDRVHVVHRKEKGRATAGIAGFKYALDLGADYILEMDADFSHNPGDIPRLLKVMDVADVAIGSRYVEGGKFVNCVPTNVALSHMANVYNQLLLGLGVLDSSGGFKCYKREVLQSLDFDDFRSKGYCIGPETLYRAKLKGFRLREIPIVFRNRECGRSKMGRHVLFEYPLTVLALRLDHLLRRF